MRVDPEDPVTQVRNRSRSPLKASGAHDQAAEWPEIDDDDEEGDDGNDDDHHEQYDQLEKVRRGRDGLVGLRSGFLFKHAEYTSSSSRKKKRRGNV